MPPDPPIFIHVGFANTGTTSPQKEFLRTRRRHFFTGEPYAERGGFFSAIKSIEDVQLDRNLLEEQRRDLVHATAHGRAVVISDRVIRQSVILLPLSCDAIRSRCTIIVFPGRKDHLQDT